MAILDGYLIVEPFPNQLNQKSYLVSNIEHNINPFMQYPYFTSWTFLYVSS
jgi:hypothetical protein